MRTSLTDGNLSHRIFGCLMYTAGAVSPLIFTPRTKDFGIIVSSVGLGYDIMGSCNTGMEDKLYGQTQTM